MRNWRGVLKTDSPLHRISSANRLSTKKLKNEYRLRGKRAKVLVDQNSSAVRALPFATQAIEPVPGALIEEPRVRNTNLAVYLVLSCLINLIT